MEAKIVNKKLIYIDEEGYAMVPISDIYDKEKVEQLKLRKLFEAEANYLEKKLRKEAASN